MRANVVLIKYPHGYIERRNDARIAAEGRYETTIEVNVEYRQQVEAIADTLLAVLSEPWRTTVGYHPVSTAEEPYTGFTIGDLITYPDHTGASATQRVVAVSVTADENGEPIFVPELGVTPPPSPLSGKGPEPVKFQTGKPGEFGKGGGQGFEGGTEPGAAGRFSGAYGSGATKTDALTGQAQGGEITFSADGPLVELATEAALLRRASVGPRAVSILPEPFTDEFDRTTVAPGWSGCLDDDPVTGEVALWTAKNGYITNSGDGPTMTPYPDTGFLVRDRLYEPGPQWIEAEVANLWEITPHTEEGLPGTYYGNGGSIHFVLGGTGLNGCNFNYGAEGLFELRNQGNDPPNPAVFEIQAQVTYRSDFSGPSTVVATYGADDPHVLRFELDPIEPPNASGYYQCNLTALVDGDVVVEHTPADFFPVGPRMSLKMFWFGAPAADARIERISGSGLVLTEHVWLRWPPYRVRSARKLTVFYLTFRTPSEIDTLWQLFIDDGLGEFVVDEIVVPAGATTAKRILIPPVAVKDGDQIFPALESELPAGDPLADITFTIGSDTGILEASLEPDLRRTDSQLRRGWV